MPGWNWNSIWRKLKVKLSNRKKEIEGIRVGELEKLIGELLQDEKKKLGEIEIIFLDDQELLKINKDFLNHNYFTDVITFDYNRKDKIGGDIFISTEAVKRNAKRFREEYETELIRVIIHGVLHLAGYNDNTTIEKREMTRKEDFYLNRYRGIVNG